MNTGYVTTHEVHDSHGRASKTTRPYFNDAPLDSELWLPLDNMVPAMEETKYDDAGRPTEVEFLANTCGGSIRTTKASTETSCESRGDWIASTLLLAQWHCSLLPLKKSAMAIFR